MTRKILIIVFTAIFALGLIAIFNRKPSVSVGEVIVHAKDSEIQPASYHTSTRYKDNIKEQEIPGFSEILKDCPSISQEVSKNSSNGDQVKGDIKVSIHGEFAKDIYYTIYDKNGKEIEGKSTELRIPTGEIDSCVVKVNVFWGKEKNYKEYVYYFVIDYKYIN